MYVASKLKILTQRFIPTKTLALKKLQCLESTYPRNRSQFCYKENLFKRMEQFLTCNILSSMKNMLSIQFIKNGD